MIFEEVIPLILDSIPAYLKTRQLRRVGGFIMPQTGKIQALYFLGVL
jgi:hypothetical protein